MCSPLYSVSFISCATHPNVPFACKSFSTFDNKPYYFEDIQIRGGWVTLVVPLFMWSFLRLVCVFFHLSTTAHVACILISLYRSALGKIRSIYGSKLLSKVHYLRTKLFYDSRATLQKFVLPLPCGSNFQGGRTFMETGRKPQSNQ